MTEHEAALLYARAGLSVFPVYGKRPVTPAGFHDASTDVAVVNAWWESMPDAGVGIAIPKWAAIVDTDSAEAERALAAMDMNLPSTLSAKGKRGRHLWYRIPDKTPVSRRIEIFPKVDLLVNGFVVAPPSKHPSGIRYQWEDEFNIDKIADCPEWILTINAQSEKEHKPIDPDELLKGVPSGQRQVALFRYACYLRADPKRTIKEAKILLKEVALASGSEDYNTDKLVDRVWKKYQPNEEEESSYKVWTLDELFKSNLPPPRFLIHQMLPAGITTVTSDPKIGKSALLAKVCFDIASGAMVLDNYKAEQCGILYLDLEQGEEYALSRWRKILNGHQRPPGLYTAFNWKRLDDGGLDMLGGFLIDHAHVGLVVIDTLADVWPIDEGDQSNVYHREQQIMGKFKRFAKDYGIGLVLVHHNRKSPGIDYVTRVSGSSAITGKSDALWSLDRERGSREGKLTITGKNIPEREVHMSYDKESLRWDYVRESY